MSQGCHEPVLTRVIQTLLRAGDVFVDVGANEGYFSILAARRVQNGRVICAEPQTRLIPVIQQNISMNNAHSVSIRHVALSDTNGHTELYLRPSSNTGASSFYKHWKLGAARQVVATKRLDDLLCESHIRHVRLVKIDCEGAELLVLGGALDSLKRRLADFWVVDYHTQIAGIENCDRAHALLSDAGYRLAKHEGLCVYVKPGKEDDLKALGAHHYATSWEQ